MIKLGYIVEDIYNSGLFLKKNKRVSRSELTQELDYKLFSELLLKFLRKIKKIWIKI